MIPLPKPTKKKKEESVVEVVKPKGLTADQIRANVLRGVARMNSSNSEAMEEVGQSAYKKKNKKKKKLKKKYA